MNIFIVENSGIARESLQSVLSDMPSIKVVGYEMSETRAIERIDTLLPDAVIIDLRLQFGSGKGVLEHVKKCHTTIKAIVFTHDTGKFNADFCKRAGADYFFDKSFQFMQLREVLWKWVHTDRLDNGFRSGNKLDALQIAEG